MKMSPGTVASSSTFVEGKMTEKEIAAKERSSKASSWKTWYQTDVKNHRIWRMKKRKGKRKGIDALKRLTYLGSLTEGALTLYAFVASGYMTGGQSVYDKMSGREWWTCRSSIVPKGSFRAGPWSHAIFVQTASAHRLPKCRGESSAVP